MDTKPTVEGPLTLISRKPRMYLQTPDQKKKLGGWQPRVAAGNCCLGCLEEFVLLGDELLKYLMP